MTQILYIRHGEVEGNDPFSDNYSYTGCQGDPLLTEKGRRQAVDVAEKLGRLQEAGVIGKIEAVFASNLTRSKETAQVTAGRLGLVVQERENLREIDWGIASGQRVKDVEKEWGEKERALKAEIPDRKTRWDHYPLFPGAEKLSALLARNTAQLQSIAKDYPGKTVVVFGHGRVLKTLIRASDIDGKGKIPYPANGMVAEFKCTEEGVQYKGILC